MKRFILDNAGQGLLELVVAIGVISVGLFSVWGLFIANFNGEQEASSRVLAINLAREGVEIVRNIRDSNWLYVENNDDCTYNGVLYSPCTWDSGLSGDGSGVIADMFTEDVYIDYSDVSSISDDKAILYTDPVSSLYSHNDTGNRTQYRRMVEIESICCDDADTNLQCDSVSSDFSIRQSCLATELKVGLNIKVLVGWSLKGKNRELSVNNTLYNWK